MKYLTSIFLFFIIFTSHAQQKDASFYIKELNNKFVKVNDYKADVFMKFDLPGVNISNLSGKVFYKKPDKFKIKAKGIFVLPKQNPMQTIISMLKDPSSYTAVISEYETIAKNTYAVLNIIPLNNSEELDIVIGKLWVNIANPLILKSEITTRNNGTISTYNTYGNFAAYALPNKMIMQVDMKKFKLPRLLSGDLNKKSTKNTTTDSNTKGKINLTFSNYKLNTKFADIEMK